MLAIKFSVHKVDLIISIHDMIMLTSLYVNYKSYVAMHFIYLQSLYLIIINELRVIRIATFCFCNPERGITEFRILNA